MQESKDIKETNTPPSVGPARGKISQRSRSFARRLKAAGIDNEDVPEDADAFRDGLTRRIHMFVNKWRGCPELLCARNRGCMAPGGQCANVVPSSAEEMERDWPRVKTEFYVVLKAHLAAHGVGEE
jgi:hypothetical protein